MMGIIYTFFLVNERNIVIDYTKKELLTYRLITSLQFFKIVSGDNNSSYFIELL